MTGGDTAYGKAFGPLVAGVLVSAVMCVPHALARQEGDPTVLHDYLEKIDTSSHHLLALINDILEMSQVESGRIELEFVPTDVPREETEEPAQTVDTPVKFMPKWLLVEDNQINMEFASMILAQMGFDVDIAVLNRTLQEVLSNRG